MRGTLLQPGDRVSIVNQPVCMLIQFAYPGFDDIVGGPKWVGEKGPNFEADRFDVTAKAETPSSYDQLQAMLRALLADRFKLAVHVEMKKQPVYDLVVARSDGHLGPNLKPEAQDCETLRAAVRGTGAGDPCPAHEVATAGHQIRRSRQMGSLSLLLRPDVDRPVIDRTGLTGSYDWELTFTPQWILDGRSDPARPSAAVDLNGPNIFTALQEQLGLKLVPSDDGVPVLVIDHIEHPTPE